MNTNKKCPSNKIINPLTNRCVTKTGKIGLKLLNEMQMNKKQINEMNKMQMNEMSKIQMQLNKILFDTKKKDHEMHMNEMYMNEMYMNEMNINCLALKISSILSKKFNALTNINNHMDNHIIIYVNNKPYVEILQKKMIFI